MEQLHTTHDQKDWFASISSALKGVTAEQARSTDGKGNHSIGQLVAHLVFWNRRALAQFEGQPPGAFSGNNDETFNDFDAKNWTTTITQLDKVMKDWEKAVENASEAKLNISASQIAHIGTHNAYHLGQIVYAQKLQGSWNPESGVK